MLSYRRVQASARVPFLGIGFEDGSFYSVSSSTTATGRTLVLSAVDPQNLLGKGTGWTDYEMSSSTGNAALYELGCS